MARPALVKEGLESLARGLACQCAGWQRLRTAPCFIGAAPSGRRTTLTHACESEVPLHGYVLGACEPTLDLNQLLHLWNGWVSSILRLRCSFQPSEARASRSH